MSIISKFTSQSKSLIGSIGNRQVSQVVLGEADSLQITVSDYGARIMRLRYPDRQGQVKDLVCGFDNLEAYLRDQAYHGAIVGRFANRIANGSFALDSTSYSLTKNDGANTLHGGDFFNTSHWNIEEYSNYELVLSYLSPDGEGGFPGNLKVVVTYRIEKLRTLCIRIRASTDKATPVSITNHAYFNLSGVGTSNIHNHSLFIDAKEITKIDQNLIPTGELLEVKNGCFDFLTPKSIGKGLSQVPTGYDHNFILNPKSQKCAEVFEQSSGIKMKLRTSQPGLQFYSGNFLDGSTSGFGGNYQKYGAFCLETQSFPDAPNHENFPSSILIPEENYDHWTEYEFSNC